MKWGISKLNASEKKLQTKPSSPGLTAFSPIAKITSFLHRMCDSLPFKIIAILSAFATIGTTTYSIYTHRHHPPVAGLENSLAPVPPVSRPNQPVPTSVVQPPPSARATGQTSYGTQSPNVRDVRRNVHIRYGSQAEVTPGKTSEKTFKIPSISSASSSVNQTSHGAQSPNVAGVVGGVDIQYGPPVARDEKKPENVK